MEEGAKKKPKTHQKRVGDWGEDVFAKKLAYELGLDLTKTKELDMAGTDNLFTFQVFGDGPGYPHPPEIIGEGKIHVQIKTSCLREYRDGLQWRFRIIKKTKELNVELWSRPNFFLGMVLVWCSPEEFTGDAPPPGTKWMELMMAGSDVIEYFRNPKTGEFKSIKHIRLMKKSFDEGKYKFLVDADDLEAILDDQMDEQREEILEDYESRRGWEEEDMEPGER